MARVNKLVVGSLPLDITEDELQTVFSTYGEVLGIEILGEDRAAGARQAHVTYRETKSAEDAITVLHEIYKIRADAEKPIQVSWFKEETSSQGAGAFGGGGGEDWNNAGKQDNSSWGAPAPAADASGAGAQTANKQPPEDSHKLFVGGLPDDISEEELRSVFGTYGEVVHVHIMKPNSMTGLRGAFVFYSKKEAGEDAIKVLNDAYKIRVDAQSPIQVRWGKDSKGEGKGQTEEMQNKLFVGSLPAEVTEEEIKTVFGTYGELTHVHLMAPHAKTGLRACLVFYAKREAGEDAIKVLNDVYKFREDSENPIQVKWGKDKDPWAKGGGKGGKGWDSWGGDSWSSSGGWGGGKGGGQGWQALGNGGWNDRSGGRGWDSQGSSWWQDRSSSWNDGWREGSWSGSSGKGWSSSDGGWGGGKGKGDKGGYDKGSYDKGGYDKGGKGCDKGKGKSGDKGWGRGGEENHGKLFVANLPEDIQDNALEYVFGTYGKVQKVHIMNNQSRNGAIAAFVEFGTAEEAETAIASLSEKYEIRPGFGPIIVRHANSSRRSRPY